MLEIVNGYASGSEASGGTGSSCRSDNGTISEHSSTATDDKSGSRCDDPTKHRAAEIKPLRMTQDFGD